MVVGATHHPHIAADLRSLKLNHRPTDRCGVAFHLSLHNDITTQCDSFLHGASDLYRLSKSVDDRIAIAFDNLYICLTGFFSDLGRGGNEEWAAKEPVAIAPQAFEDLLLKEMCSWPETSVEKPGPLMTVIPGDQ